MVRCDDSKENSNLHATLASGNHHRTPRTYPNVRRDKVGRREGRHKCSPVIEDDEQRAEEKSVPGAEKLPVSAIRILLVIPVKRTPILKSVIIRGCLDLTIELGVRETDHRVAYQLCDHCVVGHSAQDDRRKWFDR